MRPYPYVLGLSTFFVQVALGTILFATFQKWVPAELGVSDGWGGYLLAAYGAARFAFEAPTGAISDRVERRLGLLIAFTLMIPAIALMTFVRDERVYLLLAAQLGFATSFLWPATYAMSADLYPPERRGAVVGFLNLAQLLGFGAGALVGAYLVTETGGGQFAVAIGAVAAAFLAALFSLSNYRHGSLLRMLTKTVGPGLRDVVTRRLAFLSLIVLSSSIGLAMAIPAIRPYGEDQLGISFATLTVALAPAVFVGLALYLPAGHFADRVGRVRPMLAGESLIVAGLLLCAGTTEIAVAGAGAVLIFAGNVLTVPALNAAVMDFAPATHRGVLIGLMTALSGLGLAIGPAIGGLGVSAWGAPAVFQLAACVCAGTAVGIMAYGASGHRPATAIV